MPKLPTDLHYRCPANRGTRHRGTSKTFLPFSCYKSAEDRTQGADPVEYAEASDASLGRLWAHGKVLADECAANAADTGAVISTAFVARDVMQIVDALGEEDLNFFGRESEPVPLSLGGGCWNKD